MVRLTKFLAGCVLVVTSSSNAANLVQEPLFVSENSLEQSINNPQRISKEIQHLREQYAFKGILRLSGEYSFSILDKRSRQSQWLNLGDSLNGVKLIDFNSELKQLTVLIENKALELNLTDPEIPTIAFSTRSNESAHYTDSYSKPLQRNSNSQNHRATRRGMLTKRSAGRASNVNNTVQGTSNNNYFDGISNSAETSSDTIGKENNTLESGDSVDRPQIVKRPRPLKDIYQQ